MEQEFGTKDVLDIINKIPFKKEILLFNVDKGEHQVISCPSIIEMKKRRNSKSLMASTEGKILAIISSARESRDNFYIVIKYFGLYDVNTQYRNNFKIFSVNKTTGKLKQKAFKDLSKKNKEKVNVYFKQYHAIEGL